MTSTKHKHDVIDVIDGRLRNERKETQTQNENKIIDKIFRHKQNQKKRDVIKRRPVTEVSHKPGPVMRVVRSESSDGLKSGIAPATECRPEVVSDVDIDRLEKT